MIRRRAACQAGTALPTARAEDPAQDPRQPEPSGVGKCLTKTDYLHGAYATYKHPASSGPNHAHIAPCQPIGTGHRGSNRRSGEIEDIPGRTTQDLTPERHFSIKRT